MPPATASKGATPGDFDMYLLAQTWAPRFCCTAQERCTTVSWAFSASHLSLHGLWPGYSTPRGQAIYPADCPTKAKLAVDDLPRHFVDVAPSYCAYDAEKHKPQLGSLGVHEWRKHGTCSSLEPARYFGEAVRVIEGLSGPGGAQMFDRGTPKALVEKVGSSEGVPAAALRMSYAKRVAVRVDKHCRLEEVTSCWAKQPDGSVGEQVHCPAYVLESPRNSLRDDACPNVLAVKLGQCLAADQKRSGGARR